METKMQKARNVNKMLLFATLFLCVCFYGFSQKTLEGRYNRDKDFYKFYPDGTFEYRECGEIDIPSYGEGHYLLTKDSLILNFDSTKLQPKGYAILKPYKTFYGNEDVSFKIRVFDWNKQPLLEDIRISVLNDSIESGAADKHFDIKGGEIDLVFKKQSNDAHLWFAYYDSNFDIKVPLYSNFEIDVYLSGFSDYVGNGYKYVKWKYKFVRMRKDFFEVKTRGGNVLRFERTKENDYADDPFGADPYSKYLDNRID